MSEIQVENRQRAVRFDLAWLRRFAVIALADCRAESDDASFALKQLAEVEVTIVSDRTIARVHKRFMAIEGATDVITFQHGEIVISAHTAQAQAAELGVATELELALYTVHGLLHLNGYDDTSARPAARMHRRQERVMRACLEKLPFPP